MRRAKLVALLLLLTLGAHITSPASALIARDTAPEKVLRIEWNSYPDTLDPQRIEGINQDAIVKLAFEGLTRINDELNTIPGAAESWEFSPDGLTLTFHLRDGLVYSDGTPLTAERFLYTFTRVCDPKIDSPFAGVLFPVTGCEDFSRSLDGDTATPAAAEATYEAARAKLGVRALDDQTLQIELREPAVYLPAALSMSDFFPARQELIEAGGEEWWRDPANLVGNGPFVIESIGNDTDVPSKMVFIANARYWGGRPKLDRIEYIMANEDRTGEQRLAAYKRGDVDMVWLDNSTQVAVEADPDLARDLVITTWANTSALGFNVNAPPFNDKKVREAFAYGFDREAHCREIEFSFCVPTLSWIPPGVPGHIDTNAYAFDPEKARQALAESSYGGPDGLPEIIRYYGKDSSDDLIDAKWLAAQYKAVLGVDLKAVPIDDDAWAALKEDPATRPQFTGLGWVQDYPDPQDWLSVYWTCDSQFDAKYTGYCNPAFDDLVHRADAELDSAKRLALYEEAGQMLVDDVPAIFLRNYVQAQLVKPYVTGYATTPVDVWPGIMTPLTIDVNRPA
jgi:oligopeptide transport system substrate-binding protein